MPLLLDDSDEHVGEHGTADLRLHRVPAGAQEILDWQVLLDPLEEQFHLSAVVVPRSDGQRRQGRVVGQEDRVLSRLWVLETHASQMPGMVHGNQLIAVHSGSAVRGSGVNPPSVHIAPGPSDKEGTA